MRVTKRLGNYVLYDDEKLLGSIMRANAETEEKLTQKEAEWLADAVIGRLAKSHDIISTADIRQGVYEALRERGLIMTAEHYLHFEGKAAK